MLLSKRWTNAPCKWLHNPSKTQCDPMFESLCHTVTTLKSNRISEYIWLSEELLQEMKGFVITHCNSLFYCTLIIDSWWERLQVLIHILSFSFSRMKGKMTLTVHVLLGRCQWAIPMLSLSLISKHALPYVSMIKGWKQPGSLDYLRAETPWQLPSEFTWTKVTFAVLKQPILGFACWVS